MSYFIANVTFKKKLRILRYSLLGLKSRHVNFKTNQSFCALPWMHLFIAPNGDCHPCCVRDPYSTPFASLKSESLDAAWNSSAMKQLRLDLLAGKKRNDTCKNCYSLEKKNIESHRNYFNKKFIHLVDKKIEAMEPDGHLLDKHWAYWDFRLSNTCNFRCRTCGPEFSSAWQAEVYAGTTIPQPQNSFVWQKGFEHLTNHGHDLEEVYFAGGEPLLIDEHYEMLLWLLKNKKSVHLRYNTNLSVLNYKDWDILKIWRQFKSVSVSPSLDHYGAKAELIRKGTNWKKLENNLQTLLKEKNIFVRPTLTLSVFNISDFEDIHQKFMNMGVIRTVNSFSANVLYSPAHYHMAILPEALKQKAAQNLVSYDQFLYKHYGEHLSCLELLLTELKKDYSKHFELFVQESLRLDRRRGEDFFSLYPQLKPYYQEHLNLTL